VHGPPTKKQQTAEGSSLSKLHCSVATSCSTCPQQSLFSRHRARSGLQRHLPLRLPFFFLHCPEQHWPCLRQRSPDPFAVQATGAWSPASARSAVRPPATSASATVTNPRRPSTRDRASKRQVSMGCLPHQCVLVRSSRGWCG
jgi:hypothetical protein